jgi:uncharacterized damage-inducible protein DinB
LSGPEPPLRDALRLEGYAPEIGAALWNLEDCRARTLRTLSAVTEIMLDREPPLSGNSIGTLLYHIAAIETDWLFTEILEREIPPDVLRLFPVDVRDAQGRLSRVHGLPLGNHRHRLRAVRTLLLDALRAMPVDEYRRVRCLPEYRVTPAWVLHHLAQHEAEHRGQIADLRRRFDRFSSA